MSHSVRSRRQVQKEDLACLVKEQEVTGDLYDQLRSVLAGGGKEKLCYRTRVVGLEDNLDVFFFFKKRAKDCVFWSWF